MTMSSKTVALIQLNSAAIKKAMLLAFSAWFSFLIAVLFGVDNPYWAAMPVWVIAQSTRGLTVERAIYRIIGTLIGAGAGLLILATAQPIWQLVLMAGVIFCSAGALHLLAGVRSYMALLSGITVSVVVLPALLAPDQAFDLAWARIQCTLIGVVVGTLITGLGTPTSARQTFYKQVRQLASDAVQTAVLMLTHQEQHKVDQMLRRVNMDISQLEAQAAAMAAGSVEGHKRNAYVEALLFAALETLAAARQLHCQIHRGLQISPTAIKQLEDFSYQFEQGIALAPLRRQDPELMPNKVSLARLRRALGQMKRAEAALFADRFPFWRTGVSLRRFGSGRDWITARRVAFVSATAGFSAGLIAYLTQSPALELAATGVCIFSMLLGSLPRPHLIVRYVITGVTIGALLAAGYRLGIQPYAQAPFWMVMSLLPFVLLGGLARANPPTTIPALDAMMCFLLASQMGMPAASLSQVVQGSAALIFGAAMVCGSFYLLPRKTEQWARTIIRLIIKDLHDVVQQRPPQGVSQWRARISRQLLSLLQWMGAETPKGLLGLMNFGYGVIAWQRLTGRETAHYQLGLQAQAILHDFDRKPEESHGRLLALAQSLSDPQLAYAIYDIADALDESTPVLFFLHSSTEKTRAN